MTTLAPNLDPAATIRCPKCHGDMARYERSSVIVDQCLDCRGIFLDRGEIERLIDLEGQTQHVGAWPPERSRSREPHPAYRAEWHVDDDDDRRRWHLPTKRKKNLFGEIFEGFGD